MSVSFLDTSVIVRYLMEEEGEAGDTAQAIIEQCERLVVSELVLTETAHVLASFYSVPRAQIVDVLADLIGRRNVEPLSLSKESVLQALDLCRPSHRVSFTDALVWAQARAAQADRIFTFDRRFPDQDVALVTESANQDEEGHVLTPQATNTQLPTGVTIKACVINLGKSSSYSAELEEFLTARLPVEALFRERPPPPGTPMMAAPGLDWCMVLGLGASAITIGRALWDAYQSFVGSRTEDTGIPSRPSAGLLVEFQDADGMLKIVKIDKDIDQEVVVEHVREALEIAKERSEEGDGEALSARMVRSKTWIRVR